MEKNNSISVIIVSYNSAKTIKNCLDSLIQFAPNVEIIVVDNGSDDDTCEIVGRFRNKIKLIETEKNLGFSKANNIGVKSAGGEYLIFLNPDARIIQRDTLNVLKNNLEKKSQFGLIGPKLIYPDGSNQPRVRNLPTVTDAFQEYILGKKGAYDFYQPDCQNLCEVEAIIAACIIIRKKLFQEIGGFDEKYFLYFEDLDLCRKVRKKGLKVGYLPEISVEHAEGKSGLNKNTNVLLHDSAKKYHGFLKYHLIELILLLQRIKKR